MAPADPCFEHGGDGGYVAGLVSGFESGEVDPQHSTEDRYAAAIGIQISVAWCRRDRNLGGHSARVLGA